MSVFVLKLIAMISMFIDHTGAIVFGELRYLRYIGRVAFPIFAFLIANGFIHTKNVKKYLIRLGIFAILTEPIFDLAFLNQLYNPSHQNILITFFIAVLGLAIYKVMKEHNNDVLKVLSPLPLIVAMFVAEILHCDYKAYGIACVLIFYVFYDRKLLMAGAFFGINALNALSVLATDGMIPSQFYSILALPFILAYNKKMGPKFKYLFYIFYPAHMLLLWLLLPYLK